MLLYFFIDKNAKTEKAIAIIIQGIVIDTKASYYATIIDD